LLEQEACFAGCRLRASSSISQVEAEKPKPKDSNSGTVVSLQRPTDLFGKDGFVSSVSKMFSSLVDKFGWYLL